MANTFECEILKDGTIRVTSDAFTGPKHLSAEKFLLFCAEQTAGSTTRTKRTDVRKHAHKHDHDQEKA